MPLITENIHTFNQQLKGEMNLFIGSGFSTLSKDTSGRPLVTGGPLKSEIVKEFNRENLLSLELSQICQIIDRTDSESLTKFLRSRFSVGEFDKRYAKILNGGFPFIFSTNIDNLIQSVSKSSSAPIVQVGRSGVNYRSKSVINLLQLHGCVEDREEKLVFSALDVQSNYISDPQKWQLFNLCLQERPTIFIGYSLSDAGTLISLSTGSLRGGELKDRWILVRPGEKDVAREEYLISLGMKIVYGNIEDFLDHLPGTTASGMPVSHINPLLSVYLVPNDDINRPSKELYLGAAPKWFDILGGNAVKTSYFDQFLNKINGRNSIVGIGIAGSGKTTLMMQLANAATGHKIIIPNIDNQLAEKVSSYIKSPTVVFIDDFTDSYDTFNILLKNKNITLVCFDREYNFEMARHKLNIGGITTINITDLTKADCQSIYQKIPISIRTDNYNDPETNKGTHPSILEVIEHNVRGPKLLDRYRSVLEQIRQKDSVLLDVIICSSYLHYCRIPITSFNIYRYFNGRIELNEVYSKIDAAGKMLGDASLSKEYLLDDFEDYYFIRSHILNEQILKSVRPDDLRRVITDFNKMVSPTTIVRHDMFRRRAFESDIICKAFYNIEDGIRFYESVRLIDKSPFLLQQAALYLKKMGDLDRAFKYIDEAKQMTRTPHYSIRNTHAIIMFESNVRKPIESSDLRDSLESCLGVIGDCYNNDKKKLYHAISFGEMAEKLHAKYNDQQSKHFLIQALQWLHSEMLNSSWSRRLKDTISRLEKIA